MEEGARTEGTEAMVVRVVLAPTSEYLDMLFADRGGGNEQAGAAEM